MYFPPVIINEYMKEKIAGIESIGALWTFPMGTYDINEMWETGGVTAEDIPCLYDRMFRMRRSPFPHTKSEQLLYYIYNQDPLVLVKTAQAMQDFLDNEDESAEEVNAWTKSKLNANKKFVLGDEEFEPVYFHRIRVYQLEEVRDVVDFATARAIFGNKIIIDFDWHK